MGSDISFPSNSHTCSGHLAVPDSGHGPGVIVIQEWWGLVPHIRTVCDRLAADGFVALAPDLYHGVATTEPDEAMKAMMALDITSAATDMSGAVSWLLASEHATGDHVGVVGFCMGGGLALYLATLRPEIAACAPFYGVIPWAEAKPDLGAIRARVVGHWGDRDESNPREKVDELEQRLQQAGVTVEFFHYDADHAFFNDARPEVYDAAASQLAWDRCLALFRQQLGSESAAR